MGPGYKLPQLNQTRLINLSASAQAISGGLQGVEAGRLLGHNLAGVQLFEAPATADVLQVAAEALGAVPDSR